MPNIDCINKELGEVRKTLAEQMQCVHELTHNLEANTVLTKKVETSVQELVDLLTWIKTTRRIVMGLLAFLIAIFASIEGWKHFK